MDKEITGLEKCLKGMEGCLKVPNVENCICFFDAFKVLNAELNKIYNKIGRLPNPETKEKLIFLKKEIEGIKKIISKGDKECLCCSPCIASVVFKSYPDSLNNLYLENEL